MIFFNKLNYKWKGRTEPYVYLKNYFHNTKIYYPDQKFYNVLLYLSDGEVRKGIIYTHNFIRIV